jgi:hypothetical protein
MPILPMLLVAGVITFGWWWAVNDQLAAVATGLPGGAPAFAAAFATVARVLGNLCEAAYYCLAWRSFGHRVPFVRLLAWIVLLSGADLFALEMRQHFLATRGSVPLLVAAVSGIGGLPGSWLPRAFHAAFASAGLLTLVRVGYTAHAQTRATSVPIARTFALTAGTWLVTHLALGCGYALLQGRSLPGMP